MTKIVDMFTDNPLFFGIRKEDIPVMLKCIGSYERKYKKKEIVILEGDSIKNIGIILKGCIQMIKEGQDGNMTLLVNMRKGEIFGETFACGDVNFSKVMFQASEDSEVIFLPFYKVIHTCSLVCVFHHKLIENMVKNLCSKNVQLMQKVEICAKKSLREKIIAYLNIESEKQGSKKIAINLSRVELSDYLCADRSALTRELSNMQKDGLISYEKNNFELNY